MWCPCAEFCQLYSLGLVPKLCLCIQCLGLSPVRCSSYLTESLSLAAADHVDPLQPASPRALTAVPSQACGQLFPIPGSRCTWAVPSPEFPQTPIPQGPPSQGACSSSLDAQAHMGSSPPSAVSLSALRLLSAGTPPSRFTSKVKSHPRWPLVSEGYACLLAVACEPHLSEVPNVAESYSRSCTPTIFSTFSSCARHFFST